MTPIVDDHMPDRGPAGSDRSSVLVCRAGERVCALPIEHLRETMRALPVEPIAGMPEVVLGLSIVRGSAVPVVDARRLLGADASRPPSRFVSLVVGPRAVALAVDSVDGVRQVDASAIEPLPRLLGDGASALLTSLANLDGELLLVLRSARLVPDGVWAAWDARA